MRKLNYISHLNNNKNNMEWIKCSDRFPEVNGFYLCFTSGWDSRIHLGEFKKDITEEYPGPIGFYDFDEECFTDGCHNERVHLRATHWMHLPHGPKDINGMD